MIPILAVSCASGRQLIPGIIGITPGGLVRRTNGRDQPQLVVRIGVGGLVDVRLLRNQPPFLVLELPGIGFLPVIPSDSGQVTQSVIGIGHGLVQRILNPDQLVGRVELIVCFVAVRIGVLLHIADYIIPVPVDDPDRRTRPVRILGGLGGPSPQVIE